MLIEKEDLHEVSLLGKLVESIKEVDVTLKSIRDCEKECNEDS